jgi:hypothetical protein
MSTPLLDRINARKGKPAPKPEPIRKPAWLERAGKDLTGAIYTERSDR